MAVSVRRTLRSATFSYVLGMAGGPHAGTVACFRCLDEDGQLVPAERISEGVENDAYRCARGHGFAVDWRRTRPDRPQWPPDAETEALAARMRAAKT
jgi:hypothetical protein